MPSHAVGSLWGWLPNYAQQPARQHSPASVRSGVWASRAMRMKLRSERGASTCQPATATGRGLAVSRGSRSNSDPRPGPAAVAEVAGKAGALRDRSNRSPFNVHVEFQPSIDLPLHEPTIGLSMPTPLTCRLRRATEQLARSLAQWQNRFRLGSGIDYSHLA
jgi:hypothetical protein